MKRFLIAQAFSRPFNNLSIMTELKHRLLVDESDKTVKELIFNLDEQTQFAVHHSPKDQACVAH